MSQRVAAIAVALAAALAACDRPPSPGTPPAGPAPQAPRGATPTLPPHAVPEGALPRTPAELPTFRDVAAEAGLESVNHTGKRFDKDWLVTGFGGGVIALDYDSDGDLDAVVVDGTMLTITGEIQYDDAWRTRLWRNDGGMRFTDVTAASGIDLKAFGIGGASCDYDADGHPDLYVCCWGRSHLFRNRGDGTFEDVTAKAGVAGDETDCSTACAWGDVDGDGVHDLYVATHIDQRAYIDDVRKRGVSPRKPNRTGHQVAVGPLSLVAQMDRLYLGNGDGTFREVSSTHLVGQVARHGFQPVMTDVDLDGDLDIFVANDLDPNHLWINDGKGVFTDRACAAGVATSRESREQAGMGVDAEDYDRNGSIDLTLTAFAFDQDTIFLNRTNRVPGRPVLSFADASADLGLTDPTFVPTSWGVRLLDYDNDGWLDRFAANSGLYGERDANQEAEGNHRDTCQLLRNQGPPTWKFADVTDRAGPAFTITRMWRGAAAGDFDDDGDTDVLVTALNDRAALFRNSCEDSSEDGVRGGREDGVRGGREDGAGAHRNGFLRFKLVGKGGLRDPSGARVSLRMPSGRVHVAELHHGASFCGDNDPRLLFGLGTVDVVPQVDVRWPDGTTQSFRDVRGRSAYVIQEGVDGLVPDHLAPR